MKSKKKIEPRAHLHPEVSSPYVFIRAYIYDEVNENKVSVHCLSMLLTLCDSTLSIFPYTRISDCIQCKKKIDMGIDFVLIRVLVKSWYFMQVVQFFQTYHTEMIMSRCIWMRYNKLEIFWNLYKNIFNVLWCLVGDRQTRGNIFCSLFSKILTISTWSSNSFFYTFSYDKRENTEPANGIKFKPNAMKQPDIRNNIVFTVSFFFRDATLQ